MRELENKLGKIFYDKGYFHIEKVFDNLLKLMYEEERIKRRVKKYKFTIKDHTWIMEENPLYEIENIVHDYKLPEENKTRFRLKIKLTQDI